MHKERLLEAVASRRHRILPTALKIFKKLQDQQVSSISLSTVAKEAKRAQRKKLNNVESSMMKIDMLLNSPSSPVISTLKQTQKYNDKELMDNLETYTDTMDDDIVGNLPEIKDINRDSRKLETLLYEVKKIKDIMVQT